MEMEMENRTADSPPPPSPHVLLFPLPFQGPVNCMLKLAELICVADFRVTFLSTHYVHRCLLLNTSVQSRFSRYPQFRFQLISDGLPDDHPRSGDLLDELFRSMESVTHPLFREMVISGPLSSKSDWPLTCIIADGYFSLAVDVANEIGVPLFYFETVSPCGLWTYMKLPQLIESGEFPFKGGDLDVAITSVPGMENHLRRRDLPSFYRIDDISNRIIQLVLREAQKVPLGKGLILNTFEALEGPLLAHIRAVCPNLYPIGPLHSLFNHRLSRERGETNSTQDSSSLSSNSFWEDDKICLQWLDAQPTKSVIFVSIGSLAVMNKDQLLEIWHGLVNSGKRFLWVRRPGSVVGEDSGVPGEEMSHLLEETKKRGRIVGWTPQEKVLAHPAVGGFLTHSGWNSTLESMVEGVPMICWPYFVDQQVNSRFVEAVWKLGLDMKDTCDRVLIEKMVRDLTEDRRDEFLERAENVARLAGESIIEGGSSACELDRLIDDIRSLSMCLKPV